MTACTYCGLVGHTARTCWVAARGATKPDAIDREVASLDVLRLRDRPADLRFAVAKIIRRAVAHAGAIAKSANGSAKLHKSLPRPAGLAWARRRKAA